MCNRPFLDRLAACAVTCGYRPGSPYHSMCLHYKAVSRITLMHVQLLKWTAGWESLQCVHCINPRHSSALLQLLVKQWERQTPCSVVTVIKIDFRNRIQMLLECPWDALLAWWGGTFPCFDHKKVFLFQTQPTGFFIFCWENIAWGAKAYHRLSESV